MKHKLGDVVQIKSLDWYKKNKDEDGWVEEEHLSSFGFDMSEYCGMKATIASVLDDYYFIDIDNGEWCWCDYMFEDGIKFTKKKKTKDTNVVNKNYILSDKLTSIDELDELKRNKECVAWCHSDGYTYTMRSASFFMNWSYGILKTRLSNMYKVIKNDKANIIVEALAKENIIHGKNVKKAIDITRKILNKNE